MSNSTGLAEANNKNSHNALDLLQQGHYSQALEQAQLILANDADHTQAMFIVAVVCRHQESSEIGLEKLQALLKLQPNFSLAYQEIGFIYAAQGNFYPAIAHLQKAVALNDKLPESWRTMGELFLVDGDDASANEAFRQHLRLNSKNPDTVMAVSLFSKGKIGQAEQLCRKILKEDPTDVNTIRLFADIAIRLSVYAEAEKLLERCLELAPDYHLARLNYCNLLSKREKLDLALIEVNKLLALEINKPSLLVLRASILSKSGEFHTAIQDYDYLVENCPPKSRVLLSLGHAHKAIGQQALAIQAYRDAVKVEAHFGDAYWSLANLKTFSFEDAEIEAMLQARELPQCSEEDYFHICFALGKAYEHQRQYDLSFQYYKEGNDIKCKLDGHSAEENHSNVQRAKNSLSQEFFQSQENLGHSDPAPIFIVGLPRSGSTLLEQILASHSQVDGTKELVHILSIVQNLSERRRQQDVSKYPEALLSLQAEQLQSLGKHYIEQARIQRGSAPFFIDKMPNNYLHIGLIKMILPNAKIIDARRHPMACCFSGYTQLFSKGQSFTYNLNDLGNYYRDYVEVMNHWDRVLPGQVLRVHYEDVVADTESQVRRILDFCGLPFEESCLQFHQTQRAVRTASSEQVRQPIYQGALEHWHNYSAHLQDLKSSLGDVLTNYPAA